jgi:hypothetical protein
MIDAYRDQTGPSSAACSHKEAWDMNCHTAMLHLHRDTTLVADEGCSCLIIMLTTAYIADVLGEDFYSTL